MTDYIMMVFLGIIALVAVSILGHSPAASHFSAAWVSTGLNAVLMVFMLYLAFWMWRISCLLSNLIGLLTGREPAKDEFRAVLQALWDIARSQGWDEDDS